ncbi:sulfotransferase family protein [Roseomonas terrae]|uniref:Sulfotransferase family protein n=1 Tax=Neoroseomonas terrae TaxID=424799 RepID=A0ABS5EN36_9PROT|nr:hypothetical protein [Neoroseomonas terrae]MBR0652370.1 sulfotransferase family protein [Neoroseomonas terrae]
MRAVVIGFPKSGTSTIQEALTRSGLTAAHWRWNDRPIGQLVYEGLFAEGDPFARLHGLDAVTQMDVCQPHLKLNYWPNLDFVVLEAIRARHPRCLMVLNRREPAAIADSIGRWYDMRDRFAISDIPGLPRGFGRRPEELVGWIERHHAAVLARFGGDPAFLDLDVTAPDRLGAALGVRIAWWGRANVNKVAPAAAS